MKKDWKKPLSYAVKAEMLAATFHLLTDHQPEVWKTVPAWLQAQIKQTMLDCSIDAHDLTMKEMKLCVEYAKWLNKKHPNRKKRYLHYALIDQGEGSVGQMGCAWGTSLEDVQNNIDPRDHKFLRRTPQKDCPLCIEDK